MAQFYTLEEAARVLGMSPDELKTKAQSREVRAFLDGGSWRFRVADVDELARRRGLGSDAELRLSDLEMPVHAEGEGKDENLSEYQMGATMPDQLSNCASGRPASAIGGTFGNAGLRCGVITASARMRPSRNGPSTAGKVKIA